MFNLSDTIAAICTPPGVGGIAAIRISGPDAFEIAKIIYSQTKEDEVAQPRFQHMHALYGCIKDNEKIIDEVIILPFQSPKSFTAEDVVEIYCHGGNQIASIILDLCLKNGACLAKAGEFTFRAFINGRIDLTEAEAIHEIIHADTQKAVYSSSIVLLGLLKEKVSTFRERLFNLITSIESSIEFPMDVPNLGQDEIFSSLNDINSELGSLIESSEEGKLLRSGVKVVIIGAPNVGKSSLLNQFLESQRAIVANEPGTTRDTIEEKVIIDGWPVVFIDTAGIRERKSLNNEAELLGIERSKAALENADLALLVFDLKNGKDKNTEEIFKLVDGKPKIIVGNKIDLVENKSQNGFDIAISARYGTNLDKLKKLIVEKVISLTHASCFMPHASFYINQRQKELLLQCSSHIGFAIEILTKNSPEDLVADELKKAVSNLDEVTGRKISDAVIANIFAKFCIGK